MKLNRKNKLLIAGFLITLYICYAFAFSNTLEYYSLYSSQQEIVANNLHDPQILPLLSAKERKIDQALSQHISTSGTSFQNELLSELTILSRKYNLKIIDFKEPHIFVENNIRVSSYTFSFEGSFNDMLLVLNKIENNSALGFVKHITFTKKKNYKTNSDYLTSEIIIQKSETDNPD